MTEPGLRGRIRQSRVVAASGRYLESPYASLQMLLAAGCALLFIGLLMSASTTISASLHTTGDAMWTQLTRELEFVVVSVPVFWLAVRMPPAAYRRLAYPALGLAVISLVAALTPGIGATINGAHRWIEFGPLTIQPSEFAKIAILLWGADLLARKHALGTLTQARHVLVPLVPGFIAIIGLVMLEPDLGTTMCFMLLLLGLLWMVGLPYRYFTAILAFVVLAVTLMAVLEPYRMQRLTTFLHPGQDAGGAGYHTIQGLYALSSGGLFGVGLGQGTSKYGWVPNANTDYVFAIVGEELGLLGCFVVLLLFALFTYAALRIAARTSDRFVRLVAGASAIWIAGQALINIGYVTALLPVTGIPLPFISNGGTSLILTCAVFGMLVSFARHEPAAARAARDSAERATTARWVRLLRLGTPQLTPSARTTAPGSRSAAAVRPGRAGAAAATSAARDRSTTVGVARRPAPARKPVPQPRPAPAAERRPRQSVANLPATGAEAAGRRGA